MATPEQRLELLKRLKRSIWDREDVNKDARAAILDLPGIPDLPFEKFKDRAKDKQEYIDNASLRYAELPFFPDLALIGMSLDPKRLDPKDTQYFFVDPDRRDIFLLDRTNRPLYALAERYLKIDEETVHDYIVFFFSAVISSIGPFRQVFDVRMAADGPHGTLASHWSDRTILRDDARSFRFPKTWTAEVSRLQSLPAGSVEPQKSAGLWTVPIVVEFNNALFTTSVEVQVSGLHRGGMELTNETLLAESPDENVDDLMDGAAGSGLP
jgi:hypothetical protein